MPRTRHVYPTHMIASLWAAQRLHDARNPQKNFSFEGNVIRSYSTVIGGFYSHQGIHFTALNMGRYGHTTRRHQGLVSGAAYRRSMTCLIYEYGSRGCNPDARQVILSVISTTIEKMARLKFCAGKLRPSNARVETWISKDLEDWTRRLERVRTNWPEDFKTELDAVDGKVERALEKHWVYHRERLDSEQVTRMAERLALLSEHPSRSSFLSALENLQPISGNHPAG